MNVFEEAQKARPAIDGAEENIATARARLLAEMRGESQPARSRTVRRSWIIVGSVLAGAAAVTAGVLVVGSLTPQPTVEAIPTTAPQPSIEPEPSIEPQPTAEPTAEPLTVSSAFGAAGAAASSFSGLTVAPGQYLRIQTVTNGLVFYEPVNGWGDYVTDRSTGTSAWEVSSVVESYAPADQHGDWRYLQGALQLGNLYGPDAAQRSQIYLQEIGPGNSAPLTAPGGFGAPWPVDGVMTLAAFFDGMPTEPAQLISWIDDNQDTPPEAQNTKVGWLLIELLAINAGSPEVRATMYAALSMLDGFELTNVSGDDVTVALTSPSFNASGSAGTVRRTATIDTVTGLVEETTETNSSASALIPDSVPDERRTYTVSVVDSAP